MLADTPRVHVHVYGRGHGPVVGKVTVTPLVHNYLLFVVTSDVFFMF